MEIKIRHINSGFENFLLSELGMGLFVSWGKSRQSYQHIAQNKN